MKDKIKYRIKERNVFYFFGYEVPNNFEGYLSVSFWVLFGGVTAPIWMPIYLISKFLFHTFTDKAIRSYSSYICPECGANGIIPGYLSRVKCGECNWYGYLDQISKKVKEEDKQ